MADCLNCGGVTSEREMIDEVQYGCPLEVVLYMTVPVVSCSDCGLDYTDYRGEDIRQAAIDNYLKSKK